MTEEMIESMAASGDGDSMMMAAPMTEVDLSVSTAENAAASEEALLEIITFIEKVIENDAPDNKEALLDMVAYLEDELKAIRSEKE